MSKLALFSLFIWFFTASFSFAEEMSAIPSTIVITEQTSLRDLPFFAKDHYLLGHLNPGEQAEILSLNRNHAFGVSLQVKILSGEQKGRIGWVYFHQGAQERTFELRDADGNRIDVPEVKGFTSSIDADVAQPDGVGNLPRPVEGGGNGPGESTQGAVLGPGDMTFSQFFNAYAQTLQPGGAQGVYVGYDVPEQYRRAVPEEEIWQGALKGEYIVDVEAYDGGKYIPFKKSARNSYGVETVTRYYAKARPEYLTKLPEALQNVLNSKVEECRDGSADIEEAPAIIEGEWLPHCSVLASRRITSDDFNFLGRCLNSIKAAITEGQKSGGLNRSEVFRNLYSKLNPKEREFMALVMTSIGEAGILAPPLEEMIAIMKVLDNRREYAVRKGYADADVMDAALQPYQFSMYNKGAHHWSGAIRQTNASPQTINALQAYIQFKNMEFSQEDPFNRVYHYHTNYVDPGWRDDSKIVKTEFNGLSLKQSGTRHIFYRDIPWSFRNNEWSAK